MTRIRTRCAVLLLCLAAGAFGQTGGGSGQPTASDDDYRKFDHALTRLRDRNAAQFAIPPSGIDEAAYVPIGGIDQWITIRGWDRSNPVLLFLHGGPGDVTTPWTYSLFASWEKKFTTVQWDERGAGRTLAKNGPGIAPTLTLDRMTQDGIELAEYLRRHLGKPKIILVGHSFGSILGVMMVHARPDLFYAYVGTGQVGDERRNYEFAYQALLKKARATQNQQAIDDLTRIGAPPYASGDGYRVQWRWANEFEGADRFLAGTIGWLLVAPGHSVHDFLDTEEGEVFSAERLVGQTKARGPQELGCSFAVPVFLFQGAEDFTTPTALAREYFRCMKAPKKTFVAIKGGGHFAVFMKSDEFLAELVKRVRPLAMQ